MKCGKQFARSSRIVFGQFARIEAGVSDIAAPAAGNPDLLEEVCAFFKDRNASIRGQLRILKRSEKSGCTAADDC
jgi:hypothetical protein